MASKPIINQPNQESKTQRKKTNIQSQNNLEQSNNETDHATPHLARKGLVSLMADG